MVCHLLFILFSGFLSHHGVLSSQTKETQPSKEEYDYIIVGGGTAGCPLAATLSSNYKVLILEQGSDSNKYPYVKTLEGLIKNSEVEDDGVNPFQRFISEDGVENLRGRILGGSSMLNYGFYSRAHEEFFTESGVKWDMEMVEQAYQWVEETVVSQPNLTLMDWQSIFREGLLQAGLGPDNGFNLSNLVGTKIGGSIFDSLGNRHGAVELLSKGEPRNLIVQIQATVEKIIISHSEQGNLSATGVSYSDSNGTSHTAFIHKNGEIILSAGAIGSPQLLLLSGIGPKSHLSSLKLPVVLHQPHVGQFMADNPRFGAYIVTPPLKPTTAKVVATLQNNTHFQSLSTILPFSSPPPNHIFPPQSSTNLTIAAVAGKFSNVASMGSLRLGSATDVKKNPVVRFNYYAEPSDVAQCVAGVRKMRDLLDAPAMEEMKWGDLQGGKGFQFVGASLPEKMADDGFIGGFCRRTVTTYWHFHGGCLVGKVVDGEFRVIGVGNLRVVDGSTFAVSPGTNPMATVMMIGRYVGLKIIQQRQTIDLR